VIGDTDGAGERDEIVLPEQEVVLDEHDDVRLSPRGDVALEPGAQEGLERGAEAIARASDAGRRRLAADAQLIEALVRVDELGAAARMVEEQREGLADLAIDLREALAEAVRERDGSQPDELGG
jgi:hypothetical protein